MIAVLFLLLLLNGTPAPAQEAPAGRLLVLPDVILSAEDPLFLAVPAAFGWILAAPAQPPLDRRRLWAAEIQPRIRDLEALSPSSSGTMRATPSSTLPGSPPAAPAVERVGRPAADEAGLRLLYRTGATAGLDLWLDSRRGDWARSARSALTLSDKLPSSFELGASAVLQSPAWRGSLQVEGAGIQRPQASAFLAGGLEAELRREPAPFGLDSATSLLAEQREEADDAWLLLSQDLDASWHARHWGLQGRGLAFAAMAGSPSLYGLARLGLEWASSALTVSAGASLLAGPSGLRPCPEAALELRPWPPLSLKAGLAAYLEQPSPFLVREAFGEGGRPPLLPPSGLAARFSALLDAPGIGGIGIDLQAFDGEYPLLHDGQLEIRDNPHLAAAAHARLELGPEGRPRPRLSLSAEATAGLPLPITAKAFRQPLYVGLGAGLRVGFAKWPMELILQSHWGDVPVESLGAWLAERRAADWLASLTVRWEVRPPLAVEGGLVMGTAPGGLAGCTLQARRSN
jgi:hypothetical protein